MVITSNKLHLTSHRLILSDQYNSRTDLKLSTIVNTEIKKSERILSSSNNRTNSRQTLARVVIYFNDKPLIQFEFEYGGHNEFLDQLNQQLIRKHWLYGSSSSTSTDKATMSFGIAGIQKKIQDRLDTQDQKINDSFKDLNVLMNQAKEMVSLSNVLISKLSKDKIKSSDATNLDDEDEEMKKLKTCFNNMGIIDNPVTKESSGSKYHKDLALEIYNTLSNKINEQGGIMTLVDAFCKFNNNNKNKKSNLLIFFCVNTYIYKGFLNRARAIAGLISPEDHINACKQLNKLNVNLKYNVYSDLNLHVLEVTQSSISNKITQEVSTVMY